MKKVAGIIAAASLLALSGCATIVGDKEQAITFQSTPSEATITITDETGSTLFSGLTPTTTQLKKSDGSYFGGKTYTVEIAKQGYETRDFTINSRVNGWYVGGNLIFGGFIGWLVVDPLTGAMYTLSPDTIDADLTAKVASTQEGGKTLNIVLMEDVPKRLHKELELIFKA